MAVADNAETAVSTAATAADDICYRCKEVGHRAKDCPTKKTKQQQQETQQPPAPQPNVAPAAAAALSSSTTDETKICYRCKQSGHFASACPDKKRAREAENTAATQSHPVAAPSTTATSADQCYRCQQLGHRASACPTKKKQKAEETAASTADFSTRSSSHTSASASTDSSSSATANRRCYICKSADHLSSACPDKNKPRTTASKPAPPPTRTTRAPAVTAKPCYRCHSTAHSTADCPEPKHCHYCQSPSHLAADCPDKRAILRQREREKEKACNRCQQAGHIERECPTLPHRLVWRQEGKERGLGCYVCGSVEHYAVECTEVTGLEARMKAVERQWVAGEVVGEAECERLLVSCAAALEYRGAVWLLQRMAEKGLAVTIGGWEALERLHSVSGKDQSRIELTAMDTIKKPKQQLAHQIKQNRASHRHTQIKQQLTPITAAIQDLAAAAAPAAAVSGGGGGGGRGSGGVLVGVSVFGLCAKLREVLGEAVLSAKESREAVMALVKEGRLKKAGKGLLWLSEAGAKGGGGNGGGSAGDGGVEDEKERKRKLKRAQEKKRKAAKKQKLQQASANAETASATTS